MKKSKPALPPALETFIKAGHTTFERDGDAWDLRIVPGEESPFRKELPSGAIMIAENGSGDCLFLKTSSGKAGSKVFAYWHEEDRSEQYAGDIKEVAHAGTSEEARPARAAGPAVSLAQLEKAMKSSDASEREDALKRLADTSFGLDVLPILRRALDDARVGPVLAAANCLAKLGPEALESDAAQEEMGPDRLDLEGQLLIAGSKVWGYSMYPNCYSACLDALVKLEADEDYIIEYVTSHVGLSNPDDLIASLEALRTIGSSEAKDLMKRAAAFWLPELNAKFAKQAKAIVSGK